MPIAMTQEQQALQASLRDWAKRAEPLAVVRAMEPAEGHGLPPAGAALLTDLAALGVFAIPADGGTVTDLAAALEELACALVPGPVLPTLLAALILGRHADGQPAVRELLPALAQDRATASVALAAGTLTATRQPDGALQVSGEIAPVLWAAGYLLAPAATVQGDTWFLATPGLAGLTVNGLTPVDFSRELAAVRFDDVTVPPEQILAGLDTGSVRDLAATMHAAEAAGVAAWCSATAADYARTRRQFGRLIGEFLLAAGGAVNPLFAERTGVHVAGALAVALFGVRATHPAIRKLIGTEHRQAVAETVLELQGPAGAAEGEASYEFLLTRCLSIAGGTTQILLNQVAERILGLP